MTRHTPDEWSLGDTSATAGWANLMSSDYEFRIKGRISRELVATFAPLRTQDNVETVLVGTITDRAQLHGIIARFETLGLEILEFRRLATQAGMMEQSPARSKAQEYLRRPDLA